MERMLAGPSEDYKQLLRDEITPAEYIARLKEDVDQRLEADRPRRLRLVEKPTQRSLGQKALDFFRGSR